MRALLFDIDDTLYDLQEPFRRTFNLYYGKKYDLDLEKLFRYVRKYSDEVFDDSQSGKITMDDMYAYRLQKAFGEFQIDLSREDALKFQRTYEDFQKQISMTETMKACLDELVKRPVFLGIISNGAYDHQMDKVRILDLTHWIPKEHIVVSGGCDYSKPDVRIFQYAEKLFRLDHDDTWYIGDTYKNDIRGPKEAGWHAVWFNHRHHEFPEGAPEPDFTVRTEAELIKMLLDLAR